MTGRVINNLIEVRQGDSFVLSLDCKKGCKPVNLEGATLAMQVRDEGGNLKFQCLGTDVDAKNGKSALILTPSMTNIPVGDYVTDIQLTLADGSVNTLFPADVNAIGTFRITEQVTTYSPE